MRTRNIIRNNDGTYNIVWFGSQGIVEGSPDEIAEETTVYSITRENFTTNEYPIAVCGITSVTVVNDKITELIITTTYDRAKDQTVNLYIKCTNGGSYTFKDESNNTLLSGTFDKITDMTAILYMNQKNKITLILTKKDSESELGIEDLVLTYSPQAGKKIPADNYISNNNEMVSKSLIQRLGIIKGELYYNLNYGLPLLEKIRDKALFDMKIINIINNHPAVLQIKNYESKLIKNNVLAKENNVYSFTAIIITIYNKELILSSNYLL